MESVDIIKLLKEEQKQLDKARTNEYEEQAISTIFGYYDNYVKPKIKQLINQNKLDDNKERDYPFVIHIIKILLIIEEKYIILDEEDFYIHPFISKYYLRKGNDNLNILYTKDKDFKNEVATTICEVLLVRQKTKAIRKYIKMYIEPMLVKLNTQGKIIYDMNSTDEIIEQSEKIKSMISGFFGVLSNEFIMDDTNELNKEDLAYRLFLTDDYIEDKNNIAKVICRKVIEIYNSSDFKELSIADLQEKLIDSLIIFGKDE